MRLVLVHVFVDFILKDLHHNILFSIQDALYQDFFSPQQKSLHVPYISLHVNFITFIIHNYTKFVVLEDVGQLVKTQGSDSKNNVARYSMFKNRSQHSIYFTRIFFVETGFINCDKTSEPSCTGHILYLLQCQDYCTCIPVTPKSGK